MEQDNEASAVSRWNFLLLRAGSPSGEVDKAVNDVIAYFFRGSNPGSIREDGWGCRDGGGKPSGRADSETKAREQRPGLRL